MDYIDHVSEILEPLLKKREPNWGYVEKYEFLERLIESFLYLKVSDYEIIERANQMLDA